MIEPYYTDAAAQITLYDGPIERVLPLLKAFELLPEKVITVTDPPYNVGMLLELRIIVPGPLR